MNVHEPPRSVSQILSSVDGMVHIAVSWQHEHINMMLLDVLADHAALRKVVAYIVNLIKNFG